MKTGTIGRLRREQESLARRVILTDALPRKDIRVVAGADLTFLDVWRTPTVGLACFTLMEFPAMKLLERVVVQGRVTFPYIPTFLAYRELPLLLKGYRRLKPKPDVVLVDGQGIAHPRGFGIAAHFGVLTGAVTIGCAKSWLFGEYKMPARAGAHTVLRGPNRGKIGHVLRPSHGKSLLFISPGHRVSPDTSLEIVRSCLMGFKIPEPIRLSHNHLQEIRRTML